MSTHVRVYRPTVANGYEWVYPVNDGDWDIAYNPEKWTANAVRVALLKDENRGKPRKHASLPWFGNGVLALRDEALDVIGEILKPHGELIPLVCREARISLFTAPLIEGLLDVESSNILRFSTGRIMEIPSPVFRTDRPALKSAVRLAEMPQGDLFLSGDLVDAMMATHLTSGTEFKLVYKS